jgi:glycosyltransferase involved in cell wall biosynthesis
MTYERPDALRRCLGSLAQLRPPHGGFEVVVVDDGSVEADNQPVVRDFASRLRITYDRIDHRGISAARNAGIRLARGELVGFIADDYTLSPDYLEIAERFFSTHPDADVMTWNIRSQGRSLARHVQQLYVELVLLQNANAEPDDDGIVRTFTLPASRAAIFRRRVFDLVGPFDESMRSGEDGELGLRLADRGIPQWFLTRHYVDHWENKGWRDFLRQRVEYATSTWELARRRADANAETERWTLRVCARAIWSRLRPWAMLSWRTGRFTRFVILLPGLVLFLGRFYLTLVACDRAHRALR